MADRLMGAVSLCRKAGRLRMGMDLVCEEVQKGGVRLVLVADGVSGRSERKVREVCEAGNVPVHRLPCTMEELSRVTGKKYGILAVCDEGFAGMIGGLLGSEE